MRRLATCTRALVTILTVAASIPSAAQGPANGAITIGRRDSVASKVLSETRRILVYTPPSYNDTTYLPRRYPVLYLLDGDAHFHSVTGLLQILGTGVNGTFIVPEMIVVAIPNTDRTRDLTPTHTMRSFGGDTTPAFKTSGGGPTFLRFIETELIPHVESTYRTMPYRVFVGHSFGGITTINALYTKPQLFNAYVAIDPSLWWDDRTLLKQAKSHVDHPGLAGRALYVGQANTINADDSTSNPHFDSIIQFNAILEAHNNSGLRYAYKYYPSDDHGSVPMIAEYDALRFIFSAYRGNLFASLERPSYLTEHFQKISQSLGAHFDPPESMVDMLGSIEMSRDTTKAIALFSLNTELYPASPKAWKSLADARLAAGDTARAIVALQKVVSLKPGQPAATELLRKVGGKQE